MDTFFQRALPYIEMGWPVFPTQPSKVPLCEHGRNDATCVSLTVEGWSDKFPDANVSIKTGHTSGVVVIDIDSEEGERWIDSVNRSWAKLPETAEAKSGRGRHLYFAYPRIGSVKSADGKLAVGVDVKGDGGSITAPISLHATGKLYEWVKPPFGRHLPLFPQWMIKALEPPPRRVQNKNYAGQPPSDAQIDRLLGEIITAPLGQRNHTLNRIAFLFGLMVKDKHLQYGQAYELLRQAAVSAGLPQIESQPTIKSGLRGGINTLRRAR